MAHLPGYDPKRLNITLYEVPRGLDTTFFHDVYDPALAADGGEGGFVHNPGITTHLQDEEQESDPDDELHYPRDWPRWEFYRNAFVLRNYCTREEARAPYLQELAEKAEADRLRPPGEASSRSPPQEPDDETDPEKWMPDELYGTIRRPKEPEVDPRLASARGKQPVEAARQENNGSGGEEEVKYYYEGEELTRAPSPEPLPPPRPPAVTWVPRGKREKEWAFSPPEKPRLLGQPEDPQLLYFYEHEFKLIPGDVLMCSELRFKPPAEGDIDLDYVNSIAVYHDPNHFHDHGQYRMNFLDEYKLEKGDLVIRFGNFNKYFLWNRHSRVDIFIYWPRLVPPVNSEHQVLHPWYWIVHDLLPFGGEYGLTVPITDTPVDPSLVAGARVQNLDLRYGDLLIHYAKQPIRIPPFDHKVEVRIWDRRLANSGWDKNLEQGDRLVRHGMNFQLVQLDDGFVTSIATMHVELFSFDDDDGIWTYLGQDTIEFSDHVVYEAVVRSLEEVPLAGDIVFDRILNGRQTQTWDRDLCIGGLVSFHRWDLFKDWGREGRPFVWYRDKGKYGLGNTTMVLRMGTFDDPSEEWTWHRNKKIELFMINTRTSSWRKLLELPWPEEVPQHRPNPYWQPYATNQVSMVPPDFGPLIGDVILRIAQSPRAVARNSDPVLTGLSYNPHFSIKTKMAIYIDDSLIIRPGDFLFRAGYEQNPANPTWTTASVEVYYFRDAQDMEPAQWRFKGRDVYTFGTNTSVPDPFEGVEHSGFGDVTVEELKLINESKTRPMFGDYR